MIINLHPKILIVTQQLIIAADLYVQLKKKNLHMLGICKSSDTALKAINKYQPDVVIIDAGLKGAVNGIDLGSIICALKVPFIFLNPGLNEERLKLAMNAGASAFVGTPFSIEKMHRLIRDLCRPALKVTFRQLANYRSEEKCYRSEIANGLHAFQG